MARPAILRVIAVATATLVMLPVGTMESGAERPAGTIGSILRTASSWGYQLDRLDPSAIAQTGCDVLVLDYSRDGSDDRALSAEDVASMRTTSDGRRRLILAYLSIGEAEDYRFYWNPDWEDPRTRPEWLGKENPAWPGNYQVAYWHPDWQQIISGSPESYVDRIVAAGFDGLYLDRVDGYLHWWPDRGKAPVEMVNFVKHIAAYARGERQDFAILVQNGELLLADPDYLEVIDAVAKEDLFFGVDGDDRRNPESETIQSLELLALARQRGLPIFLVEYLSDPTNIALARHIAAQHELVINVAHRALNRLPEC